MDLQGAFDFVFCCRAAFYELAVILCSPEGWRCLIDLPLCPSVWPAAAGQQHSSFITAPWAEACVL